MAHNAGEPNRDLRHDLSELRAAVGLEERETSDG
jgi:hypothetical protein